MTAVPNIARTTPSHGVVNDGPVLEHYFPILGDARTARHASETYHNSPAPALVNEATKVIRDDIRPAFIAPTNPQEKITKQLSAAKEYYWSRAQHVGVEHGARAGYAMEDYLRVESDRSYDRIKEKVETHHTPGSAPRILLSAVDSYHTALHINPAHAATITMELISRNFEAIKATQEHQGSEPTVARTMDALHSFIEEVVPQHIQHISRTHGHGDTSVKPYLNKASFYPTADSTAETYDRLLLPKDDASGVVDVYDLQNRPYDAKELAFAQTMILLPHMQLTLINLHEELVEYSKAYLAQHPERAQGDLRNFSEIFIPFGSDLLPNPKLIRAMANNILPGIARHALSQHLEAHEIEPDTVQKGIQTAIAEHQLFNSNIGEFRQAFSDTSQETAVEWASVYKVQCPAATLFPQFLRKRFADHHAYAKTLCAEI